MSKEKYTALILGATGLIGNEILQLLLKDEKYSHVYAVARKTLPITNDKLTIIIADIDNIETKISNTKVDHLFCAIGTTKNKVSSNEEYYKIDHDYPIHLAMMLKQNGCNTISLVSSMGANTNSSSFYLKLKGQVEQSITALNFEHTYIFRPSLLIGKRNEVRILENIAKVLSPLFNIFMVGNLKNYKSIKAETVAKAMVKIALSNKIGTYIYQTEEIKEKA